MKIKFITLGCKVNQYEAQSLAEKFQLFGYRPTKQKADLYVINTCSVTSRADIKSKTAVFRAKKENPTAKIAVCGCGVELDKKLVSGLDVDYVVGQSQKYLLPEIISGGALGKDKPAGYQPISYFLNQRAFVKVQDGCDNFCSFCKIPFLRGPSRSKKFDIALEEIRRVSLRHKEIVLCGVNLALYGQDLKPRSSLYGLVSRVLEISHLGRLRLSSLEPFSLKKKFFSLLADPKLCPHLHFPFQYADDRILKAMRKKENVSLYRRAVSQARKIKPQIAISCDIMVGFPGEDEKSFSNTVEFLKEVRPMRIHIFTFSPREKTELYKQKSTNQGQVRKRYAILKDMAKGFAKEYQEKFIGKTLEVITEEFKNGYTRGYAENYIKIQIKGELSLGKIVPVKIKRANII